MKINIFLTSIILFLSLSLIAGKNSKMKSQAKNKNKYGPMQKISTQPEHITNLMTGHINTNVPDRSPMWKNFKDNRFNRPFMHGVVGPQWSVPAAEVSDGFHIIASPMPKPDLSTKILPGDLPERTYTPTSFDNPLRKDIVQLDIPTQITRTKEESSDPRSPPKRPVTTVSGTIYHGTGSNDPKVIHGTIPSFLEKSSKNLAKNSTTNKTNKKTNKNKTTKAKKSSKKIRKNLTKNKKNNDNKNVFQNTRKLRIDGLAAAKQAYNRSGAMLGAIDASPKMVLDVHTTNKREKPEWINQYENNAYLKARVNGMRRSPHGVKAAHTIRRLGR